MTSRSDDRYYSSADKDVVRERFDRPLLEAMRRQKDGRLRYFGLPGPETLDLNAWGDLIESVTAVEVFPEKFKKLKERLDIYYSHTRPRAFFGDVDQIILKNGSRFPSGGGAGSWQFVATNRRAGGYIWDFDVVYLDYFGKFLPYDRGARQVRARSQALRHLFAPDREDAWQPWLLLVTVESQAYGPRDRKLMREYLASTVENGPPDLKTTIDFILESGLDRTEETARLIHGTLAFMIATAASNADVSVLPRGTLSYKGAEGTPMLHLAYSIRPEGTLSPPQAPLPLLRAPLLELCDEAEWPWFRLSNDQPPGQTLEETHHFLDFLEETQIAAMTSRD